MLDDTPEKKHINSIVQLCEVTSIRFAKKADSVAAWRTAIDVVGVLFALLTGLFTLVPSLSQIVGENGNAVLAFLAATMLVIRSLIERVIFKDPPSRYRDYSHYIGLYPQKITGEMVKERPNMYLVGAWLELAKSNLTDARSKWSKLVPDEPMV